MFAGQQARAVTATVAAAGTALKGTTQVLTSGSGVASATAGLAAAAKPAIQAVGAVVSSVASTAPANVTVSLGTTGGGPSPREPDAGVRGHDHGRGRRHCAEGHHPGADQRLRCCLGDGWASRRPPPVAAAGTALQGTAQGGNTPSQGGSGQGSSPQPTARNNPATQTVNAQASSGKSATPANALVSPTSAGTAEGSVTQALPATGTLPGVG